MLKNKYPTTFHFKIDLNSETVGFKKEVHQIKEDMKDENVIFIQDDQNERIREGNSYLKRIQEDNEKNLMKTRNQSQSYLLIIS